MNLACLRAAILIAAPVRGLRPVVAARFATAKVPKPTKRTSSPFFKAVVTEATKASTALAASDYVKPVEQATLEMSSFLFTVRKK